MSQPTTQSRAPIQRRPLLSLLGLDLERDEARLAWTLFWLHFLLLAGQYASKSVRQATFVDVLGATRLPLVYLLIALASFPVLRLYGKVIERRSLPRVLTISSLTAAVVLIGFWWLFGLDAAAPVLTGATVLFYLWIGIAGIFLISQLWCLAGSRLDPRQARRLFGLVGAGGLLGGIAGGQIALVASRFETRAALLAAAVALVFAAALARRLDLEPRTGERHARRTDEGGTPRAEAVRDGLRAVGASGYMRLLAVTFALSTVVAQVIDLQFSWAIETHTRSLDQRTALFGLFYSVTGTVALIFQLLFTTRIHRRLGVGFALRVLPLGNALGSVFFALAALVAPGLLLPAAWLLKLGDNGLRYGLDQATRELLFLPVPASARPRAKVFIDVFVQRAAKGLGALLLLSVTFGWLAVTDTVWLVFAAAAATLVLVGVLRRRYVDAYRASLLESSPAAEPERDPERVDAALRERARAVLEAMRADRDPEVRRAAAGALGEVVGAIDPAQLVRLLYDADVEVVRAAVGAVRRQAASGIRRAHYLPILISHLRDRRLERAARRALVAYGERAIPALQHFMRDPPESIRVRRALPAAIASIGGHPALTALVAELAAPDPFLRQKVITALARLGAGDPVLRPATAVIEGQLAAECHGYLKTLVDLESLSGEPPSGPALRGASSDRPRELERLLAARLRILRRNLFGLLALIHPARDVEAARRGLESGETSRRAHALEYLDNLLAGEPRRLVFAVIENQPLAERLERVRRHFALTLRDRDAVLLRLATRRRLGDADAERIARAARRRLEQQQPPSRARVA